MKTKNLRIAKASDVWATKKNHKENNYNYPLYVLIFLLALVTIFTLGGCKKEDPILPPVLPTDTIPQTTSGMSNFFNNNGAEKQTFTIDASQYQNIIGKKGTIIRIPKGAFVTQSNQPVQSGDINIELKEIFTKDDMILSGAPTTSQGLPLISGGEIFIKAFQNGEELKLASKSAVYVQVPAGDNPSFDMQEFYTSSLSATDTSLNSDWNLADSSTISVTQDTVGTSGGTTWTNYYSFYIDSVNWINCDYFWNDPSPRTGVTVTVEDKFNFENCVVFLSVNGINSVASMYYNDPNSYKTSGFPVGREVTFVAISEIDGQYYAAFVSSTLADNHNEALNLQATTLEEIKSQLSSLP